MYLFDTLSHIACSGVETALKNRAVSTVIRHDHEGRVGRSVLEIGVQYTFHRRDITERVGDNPKVDLVQLGVDFLHLVTFRLGVYPEGGVIISAES